MNTARWPSLPYDSWSATCDTLHAHAQVLGKVAVALAPPEPQLQHGALHLTARGWETNPLPAPDRSGALVVALDLHRHHAVAEHSGGRTHSVALAPDRPVADVTNELRAAVNDLVGTVSINTTPQETAWTAPLDEDVDHATYDSAQVETYFAAATQAALVLAAIRAPYRGRATPVNAWWGTFDLAVGLFSGRSVEPPSDGFITRNAADAEQIEIGWWPGDVRHPRAAFFAFAYPVQMGLEGGIVSPSAAHWDAELGEYILDWDDVLRTSDPHETAVEFGRSVIRHASAVCNWDHDLATSIDSIPPPLL
jgi:hypothetical protein